MESITNECLEKIKEDLQRNDLTSFEKYFRIMEYCKKCRQDIFNENIKILEK